MDPKPYFLKSLADIKQKIHGDHYDLIRACGLLRQLLIDRHPFVDQVNTDKDEILFHVSDYKMELPIKPDRLFFIC